MQTKRNCVEAYARKFSNRREPCKGQENRRVLGKDFKVMSSYGHIRDLKKKELSIDEKSMEPCYEIPEEKKNSSQN